MKKRLCWHKYTDYEFEGALKNGKMQYFLICAKCGKSKVTCKLPRNLKIKEELNG